MLKFLKPLSFIPAICMMYIIFGFSAQDGETSAQLSYKISYEIVEVGGKVIGADFEPWEIDHLANRFHTPVRKIAHMTEYFLLAIAVSFPLYVYGLRGILLLLVAGGICVAFACGDEYHQSYVGGRSPSKRDVLIDSFGVFWGIILVRIIGWTGRKTIFRPFGRKKNKAEYQNPQYQNPQFQNPQYQNPPYQNPPYQNPQYQNLKYQKPQYQNPPYQNPPYQNPQYQNPQYQNPPYQNLQYQNPQHRSSPYQGPVYSDGYPGSAPHQQPYPPVSEEGFYDELTTSDQLSEDLSFKKLMHDIKDQKAAKRTAVPKSRKSSQDEPRIILDEIDLDK